MTNLIISTSNGYTLENGYLVFTATCDNNTSYDVAISKDEINRELDTTVLDSEFKANTNTGELNDTAQNILDAYINSSDKDMFAVYVERSKVPCVKFTRMIGKMFDSVTMARSNFRNETEIKLFMLKNSFKKYEFIID